MFALNLNVKLVYLTHQMLPATSPDQSEPESNGNELVLCIPQSISITGASPSDGIVSYSGHLLGEGVLLLCRDAVGIFYCPS